MSDTHTKQVSCPSCGQPVTWCQTSTYRPFCSERCKMQDLGAWFTEEHRIPGEQADIPSEDED